MSGNQFYDITKGTTIDTGPSITTITIQADIPGYAPWGDLPAMGVTISMRDATHYMQGVADFDGVNTLSNIVIDSSSEVGNVMPNWSGVNQTVTFSMNRVAVGRVHRMMANKDLREEVLIYAVDQSLGTPYPILDATRIQDHPDVLDWQSDGTSGEQTGFYLGPIQNTQPQKTDYSTHTAGTYIGHPWGGGGSIYLGFAQWMANYLGMRVNCVSSNAPGSGLYLNFNPFRVDTGSNEGQHWEEFYAAVTAFRSYVSTNSLRIPDYPDFWIMGKGLTDTQGHSTALVEVLEYANLFNLIHDYMKDPNGADLLGPDTITMLHEGGWEYQEEVNYNEGFKAINALTGPDVVHVNTRHHYTAERTHFWGDQQLNIGEELAAVGSQSLKHSGELMNSVKPTQVSIERWGTFEQGEDDVGLGAQGIRMNAARTKLWISADLYTTSSQTGSGGIMPHHLKSNRGYAFLIEVEGSNNTDYGIFYMNSPANLSANGGGLPTVSGLTSTHYEFDIGLMNWNATDQEFGVFSGGGRPAASTNVKLRFVKPKFLVTNPRQDVAFRAYDLDLAAEDTIEMGCIMNSEVQRYTRFTIPTAWRGFGVTAYSAINTLAISERQWREINVDSLGKQDLGSDYSLVRLHGEAVVEYAQTVNPFFWTAFLVPPPSWLGSFTGELRVVARKRTWATARDVDDYACWHYRFSAHVDDVAVDASSWVFSPTLVHSYDPGTNFASIGFTKAGGANKYALVAATLNNPGAPDNADIWRFTTTGFIDIVPET